MSEAGTKGERTRDAIVERASHLFNVRGYAATSIAEILTETGLEKGGLYHHFASKDDLALAAFDRAVADLRERHRSWIAGVLGARATLEAFLTGFESMIARGGPVGGCPLLNTAIEATDGHPALRKRARAAFDELVRSFERTIAAGIEAGEFARATDGAAVASTIVASLEGGVMLSRLYRDPIHLQRVIAHLRSVVAALVVQERNEA